MITYLLDLASIFDLSPLEVYNSITSSLSRYYPPDKLVKIVMDNFDIKNIKPFPDFLYLDELSYRGRILVITNLPKIDVKIQLMRYNIDVFIQDVISPEDTGNYFPSREILTYISKRYNTSLATVAFITPNVEYALFTSSLGIRTILLIKNKNSQLPKVESRRSLKELVEITAQHNVDSLMGDSSLRCT
ncbi:HAD family hydrolase [Sulfolobus tengchongensis]|uniref:HAD family hydrolase n=1 Tax=Sulfolobus tengchongensis TaxID=207809 RepID=A0AAX4KWU1_9CREN